MKLRTKINLCITFVWIGAILAVLSRVLGDWSLLAGLAIFVGATFCRYGLLRCPHCGHALSDRKRLPATCPKCGKEL